MMPNLKYTSHANSYGSGLEPEPTTRKRTMSRRYIVRPQVSARGDHCPFDYSVTNRSELVRRFNIESNNEHLLHTDGVEPKIPPAN